MKSNQEPITVPEMFDQMTGYPCFACHDPNEQKRQREEQAWWFAMGCALGSFPANTQMPEETINKRFRYLMELLGYGRYRLEAEAKASRAKDREVVGGAS